MIKTKIPVDCEKLRTDVISACGRDGRVTEFCRKAGISYPTFNKYCRQIDTGELELSGAVMFARGLEIKLKTFRRRYSK